MKELDPLLIGPRDDLIFCSTSFSCLLQTPIQSPRRSRGRGEARPGRGDRSVEEGWGSTPVPEPSPRVPCTPWSGGRERERPGEGRGSLICTSEAANRLWRGCFRSAVSLNWKLRDVQFMCSHLSQKHNTFLHLRIKNEET